MFEFMKQMTQRIIDMVKIAETNGNREPSVYEIWLYIEKSEQL